MAAMAQSIDAAATIKSICQKSAPTHQDLASGRVKQRVAWNLNWPSVPAMAWAARNRNYGNDLFD
jgi:hypothetical protein